MAVDLLYRARVISDHRQRARIYARAAALYSTAEPPEPHKAFALWELAAQLAPDDTSLRFDLAHAYADNSAHGLAYSHYAAIVAKEPDNAGSLNNMGVAAAELNMPATAKEAYEASAGAGNTLATANIAWKLINAGFLSEARSRLEPHITNPEAHRNVMDAFGGIAKRKNEEDSEKEQLAKRSKFIVALRTSIGESLASGTTFTPGIYIYSSDSRVLRLSIDSAGRVTGELEGALSTRELKGQVVGLGITFSWSTRKPKDSAYSVFFLDSKGTGLLVDVGDGLRGYFTDGDTPYDPTSSKGYTEYHFTSDTPPAQQAQPLLGSAP